MIVYESDVNGLWKILNILDKRIKFDSLTRQTKAKILLRVLL